MLLHCLGSERRSGKVWRVFWGGEEIEEKERKETKKAALQRSNIYIYILDIISYVFGWPLHHMFVHRLCLSDR